MPAVLIVEDEPRIAEPLMFALEREHFVVSHVTLGQQALDAVAGEAVDLVVLDVGLPDMNGFDVLKQLRQHSELPVLFLTARQDEVDRILGLELGGDDYVTKPFSPREVVARIRAILKRLGPKSDADIDTAMRGNVCRCGMYGRIRSAIKQVAGASFYDAMEGSQNG